MSRLLDFYHGQGPDREGRHLDEVLAWDDDQLEAVHDFIQWLFPLPEPSRFNPDAPLLSPDDVVAFRAGGLPRANLKRSFERILTFLGLERLPDGTVEEGPTFPARAADAWAAPNHNWLRITRILRSLHLLGLEEEAEALYRYLSRRYHAGPGLISDETFRYWTEAVRGAPFSR